MSVIKNPFAETLTQMLGIETDRAKYLFQYAKNHKDKPVVETIRMAGDYLQDEGETLLFVYYLANIKGNMAGQKRAAEKFTQAAPTKENLGETVLGKMKMRGGFPGGPIEDLFI